MPDLDYGYEVTIAQNATFDPTGTATNQWQRQIPGNTNWESIAGATNETYKVAAEDRSAKLRLEQSLNGAKVYSNELQVTSDEFATDGLGQFGYLTGNSKWQGGVLAPNGKIYGIPYDSTEVLVIDPINKTTTTFGDVTTHLDEYDYGYGKWSGGALASNGEIFALVRSSSRTLRIDPISQTLRSYLEDSSDDSKHFGGVLASNGTIYLIPDSAWDGTARAVATTDDAHGGAYVGGLSSDRNKWKGGVRAPNGKIYGIPFNSTKVFEITPKTQSSNTKTTTFGSLSGSGKWVGGVLAPNGKIYGIPYNSSSVLEIDPSTQTTTTFGSLSGSNKWQGGVLAPNGKIYGIPYDSPVVLEIDPVAKTVRTLGNVGSEQRKWSGGILAPNGKIYGIPYSSTSVLEMDFDLLSATGAPGSENWALSGLPGNVLDPRSAYFNKL